MVHGPNIVWDLIYIYIYMSVKTGLIFVLMAHTGQMKDGCWLDMLTVLLIQLRS